MHTTFASAVPRERLVQPTASPVTLIQGILQRAALFIFLLVAFSVLALKRAPSPCSLNTVRRGWARRRLRLINRMRLDRAIGLGIAAVGLLVLWLSILFKVMVEPVPYVTEPIDLDSKDSTLRHMLEAQHPSQQKNYEIPERQLLTPRWGHAKHSSKTAVTRESATMMAYATTLPAMAAVPASKVKTVTVPASVTHISSASTPAASTPLILKLSKESARAQQVGLLTRKPIELQEQKVAVVQVIAASEASESLTRDTKNHESVNQLISAIHQNRANAVSQAGNIVEAKH